MPLAVLSLVRLCYMACSSNERLLFDEYDVPLNLSVASCCKRLCEENECQPQSIGYTAAKNGHIDCLDAACRLGCQLNINTAKYAVSRNQFSVVVWMHQHGFVWDLAFTKVVVSHGAISLLQYGYEHGCPWDNTVALTAVKFSQRDCLQFLYKHGCPCDKTMITRLDYLSKLRATNSRA